MNINIAKKNLEKLQEHPKGNFTVSKKEKLVYISSWNLIGRLVKWIHNRHGEITKKVQRVIRESREACETVKKKPIVATPLLQESKTMAQIEEVRKSSMEKDPLYSLPIDMMSKTRSMETISIPPQIATSDQDSELVSLLEYLLINELITPKEYDDKLKEKDFSKLPTLRKLKKNHQEIKKLKKANKIDKKIATNPESFLTSYVEAYLAPYFQGNITAENEDKSRPPLIQKLYQEFKAKFPESKLTKDELETFALDAYIESSSINFLQLLAITKENLQPRETLLPALQTSIAIDFKGIQLSDDKVMSKINAGVSKVNDVIIETLIRKQVDKFMKEVASLILEAVDKPGDGKEPLITQLLKEFKNDSKEAQAIMKETAIERYLELYREVVKEKMIKEKIDPDNAHGTVHAALAKLLPEMKKGLKMNFPDLSEKAIDTRAEAAIKELEPVIIYEIIKPNK